MRTLRWAAELAASNDALKSPLGIQELQALRKSKLLTAVEEDFIDAALKVAIEPPLQAITQSAEGVEVVLEGASNAAAETAVPSEEGEHRGEAGV